VCLISKNKYIIPADEKQTAQIKSILIGRFLNVIVKEKLA
jgi:hypothetical protein